MPLKRVLGRVDAAWLVAGNMVGAGIFVTPGLVAGQLPGPAWCLVAWLLGGVLALAGAATYAELGARIPRAGGDYQYLLVAFGPGWGFLTAWAAFMLTFSASAAALSITAVDHARQALGLTGGGHAPTAVGAVALLLGLTAANARGARVAGRTTAALTAIPILGLGVLFLVGLAMDERAPAAALEPAAWSTSTPIPMALALSMIPVFFTYGGWNAAAYVAGEIREPGKNLPWGLLAGTSAVACLYLAVNAVLVWSVPPGALRGSESAAAEAARLVLGDGGVRALAGFIALAILGSINVTLMAGARIYFAVARDGLAPAPLARLNAASAPSAALWTGGAWAALLAATGTVQRLVSWATLAMLLLSALTVAGLFVLRRRQPEEPAFRCPGYPWTPLLYLVTSLGVAAAAIDYAPRDALLGVLLVLAGWPVYRLLRRHQPSAVP
jgi:APA family basic amino acid/polyamine antiporter